jgi:hypothetical protein
MHDYVDFWGVRNMTLSASKQLVSDGRKNELEIIWKEVAMPDQHNILAFIWSVRGKPQKIRDSWFPSQHLN